MIDQLMNNFVNNTDKNLVNEMELSSIRTRISRRLSRADTNTSNNLASINQLSKRAQIWYRMKASLVKYSSFIGPGLMVSVAYIEYR